MTLALACRDAKGTSSPHLLFKTNGVSFPLDSAITPALDPNSFNWLVQQNGGGFDPVLFADYRESQDPVAYQDFGAFFNDAFPIPEVESPEHEFKATTVTGLPKPDLIARIEAVQDGKEDTSPGEDSSKLMPCNKIWFVSCISLSETQC